MSWEQMGAGKCLSLTRCENNEHRIFRPDPIPSFRYMIRRDLLSFAALDIVVVLGEHRLRPMIPDHSVRVQSESIARRVLRTNRTICGTQAQSAPLIAGGIWTPRAFFELDWRARRPRSRFSSMRSSQQHDRMTPSGRIALGCMAKSSSCCRMSSASFCASLVVSTNTIQFVGSSRSPGARHSRSCIQSDLRIGVTSSSSLSKS